MKIRPSSNEFITIKSLFLLFAVDVLTFDALTQSILRAVSERDDNNNYSNYLLCSYQPFHLMLIQPLDLAY